MLGLAFGLVLSLCTLCRDLVCACDLIWVGVLCLGLEVSGVFVILVGLGVCDASGFWSFDILDGVCLKVGFV